MYRKPNPFAPLSLLSKLRRVPRSLLVVLSIGVAVFGFVVVGVLAFAVWFGIQAFTLLSDAPAALTRAAEQLATSPALVATLDRKLACVEAVGGPSADSIYAQALDYAPTAESRTKIEALGKELDLPRDASVTPGSLLFRCVRGTPLEGGGTPPEGESNGAG